jgi:hypothetical protein
MVNRITTYYPDQAPPPYPVPNVPDFVCTDVEIANAYTGLTIPDPFSYTGPYSLTIANVDLEDAAGHALSIYGCATLGKKVNDIYIHDSAINSSEVTGIVEGVIGEDYKDHRACDNNPDFKDDTSLYVPRNIRIEDNTFQNNLTGALGVNEARWVALRHNTLTNNYNNPQLRLDAGGSVFFDHCTDKVQIYRNTLTGPTYLQTDGLELWGRNIDVGADDPAQRNTISNYLSEGIGANSVFNAKIKNNTTSNNGAGNSTGGILVWTREPGGPCEPLQRDTKDVTISANTSTGQTSGVYLGWRDASTNTIDTVAVANSGPVFLDPYVTLTGQVSGLPAPGPPVDDQLPPRALPVNPMKDLAAPIRAVPSKCSEPGNRREVFGFPASDVDVEQGAGNISWLQGIFSVAGDDKTGSGGPDGGGAGCHFLFYPPADKATCTESSGCGALYLDGDNGNFNWVPESPSVVGPGAHDLANSYCKIRAGSLDSRVSFDGKVLNLKLDIEFFFSSKRHMYAITENRDGRRSDSGAWRYWGWWSPTP